MWLGKLVYYLEKYIIGFFVEFIYKGNFRLIKYIYMKGKVLKLIESNIKKIVVI